jgi:DNA gyrase/topoisomerase IV subunit A
VSLLNSSQLSSTTTRALAEQEVVASNLAQHAVNEHTHSPTNLVDETNELMVISQFGKIIRIDTNPSAPPGPSTQGVKLLDLKPQDKVAAAVVAQPEEGFFCGLERERIAREADFS